MVFESVVADLLNRFIGDYVENLDHSQLKIGIWGGDVVLQDLVLKQTALDDLNLPVKTVFGTLGKLVLKIPWKQLYSAPVEASVDTLFLLVVPNQEVKYDPTKEEKWIQDAKQTELLKIEEAKKLEKQKDKPKADDTFLEKLATNIIKNVQVKIANIHIRYEDKITKPLQPFSLGVTLHNVSVHTTDENWKACVLQEAVTMIHKILTLEGLALYWNPNSPFYLGRSTSEMVSLFKEGICSKSVTPKDYKYMLGPINSSAKLRLNPKPENDGSNYTIPKVHLSLEMEKLSLAISRFQFHDLIDLLESFGRMSRAAPYRKYRPFVSSYKGHYKEWWKFAYTCVLEESVRRRRRNWDWGYISKHRGLCHTYSDAYQAKLTSRKISPDLQAKLDNCEKNLDVLNIVLIRQRIEVEVERQERKEKEMQKHKSGGGWFSNWFGGGTQVKEEETLTAAAIAKKFEEAMTPEEKAKLFRAIDYQENMKPTLYPTTFVENYITFVLNCLSLEVQDDSLSVPRVLSVEFKGVASKVEQRPSADALKVTAQIEELTVFGLKQRDTVPHIVSSKEEEKSKVLLDVLFETKPLDEACDQRIHLSSKPLKVIYDAETVNKIVDIFTAPKHVDLSELQAAAESKLADFKEMSATGLQYAIEQQNVLELKVDFQAPYVILPYSGFYTGNENALVVNLGSFKMISVPRDRITSPNVRALHSQGTTDEEILRTLMSHSYDHFKINLEQVQVLIALKGEDWMTALSSKSEGTAMHLLLPTNLSVELQKCLITDDPRLPRLKIIGHLPNVEINITDTRLLQLITLFSSVPWPGQDELASQSLQDTTSKSSSLSTLNKLMDMTSDVNKKKYPSAIVLPESPKKDDELIQFTDLDLNFQMGELKVSVHQASEDEKLIDFHMLCLEVEMVQRTFDMKVILRIGGINLVHYDPVAPVCLLDTPLTSGSTEYLLTIIFLEVNKKSPEFHTKYGSVLRLLDVNFSTLTVLLHQESLLTLLEVYNTFMPQFEQAKTKPQDRIIVQTSQTKVPLAAIPENEIAVQFIETTSKPKRRKRKAVEEIDFKLIANLDNFKLEIGTRRTKIASLLVKGVIAGIIMKKTHMIVNAKLKDLVVYDPCPDTIHSNILSIMGEEVMSAQVVIYNLEEYDGDVTEKTDMSVQASMACLRVVFLNCFVTKTLNFLNSFQEAQQAIKNAAADAAEAAKQNMQEAYQKAVKLSLDIKLQAPLIVIPVNSMSLDVLLLDFGNLTMSNSFRTLSIRNVKGFPAVMDELHLDLMNLKLCRARLANDAIQVIKEIAILQPITFQLVMQRNLSVGWYKEVPDLDLSGRLKSINVTLAQEDFHMIMEVLNGNLQEQPPQQQETVAPGAVKPEITWSDTGKSLDRPETLDDMECVTVETEVKTETKEVEQPKQEQSEEAPVYTKIKFTLTMESLVIDLFTGGSKELTSEVPSVHLPENGLGRFSLHILSIKGRILSDTSLITSILLVDCLLDDTRTTSDIKIKRLMERKTDNLSSDIVSGSGEAPFRSMIDMTFQYRSYSNANDMFVDIRIFGFTLTVCLSYLMKISDFFTSGMAPSPPPPPSVTVTSELASHSSITSAKSSRSTVTKSKSAITAVSNKEAASTMMTVNIRVEKPDIILVENMDDLDTNSIILNNEITFKLRVTENRQVMNGVIKDLQLYSCCFNPKKRKDTMTQILYPCSISLAGSTPEGQGLHLDVCMSDIRLRVSPATIGLLSNIQGQLAVGVDDTGGEVKELDYSNIWNSKSFQDVDYWFLKTELGEDAVLGEQTPAEKPPPTGQVCMLSAPSIVITMEAGVGSQTLPMMLVDVSFRGTVMDWSTQMNVSSSLTLQMSYYNSQLALWEPLIEPVEQVKDGKVFHGPWELCAEVHMNPQEPIASPLSQVALDMEDVPYVPPAMSIDVTSKDNLELTVTKTCLDVLSNLGKAFQTAMKEGLKKHKAASPYIVQNDTGLVITLLLDKGPFKVQEDKDGEMVKQVVLQSGAKVGLSLQHPEDISNIILASPTPEKGKVPEKLLSIKINEMRDTELELPVVRADKRYFSLNHRGDSKDTWGLVSDITVLGGGTIITLRSIVQILNHFSEPIDVYYMTRRGNEVECIGTVESGEHINLPLYAVYTPTNELFFSVKGYTVSVTPFVWKDLQNQLAATKLLQCDPKNNDKEPFFMKIVGEMEQVYFEKSSKHTMSSTCYNIHLRPAVILKNFLPLELICCVQGIPTQKIIKAGESMQMPTAEPGNTVIVLRIPDYLDKEWSCKHEIQQNAPDFSVWTFDSHDSVQKVSMDLGMHTMTKKGSIVMSLYCPFWMLNKTGVMLSYRQFDDSANVIFHPEDYKGPILFSFKAKSFFGKKKASIKVEDGEWSEKFSLDVAGSSGVISCNTGDTIYQIGIHIQLTNSTLTKQVIFMPYYVLVNNATYPIEVQESDRSADPWMKVRPGECTPFWPRSKEQRKELRVRILGTADMSASFAYTTVHTTLLRLDNKYGGLNVDVQMTEGAVYVTFSPYEPGMAPALILNHTNFCVTISEKGSNALRILKPYDSLLFAWEQPTGPRAIVWKDGKKKEITDELRKDGIGEFTPIDSQQQMWWVSFLNGMQRVLLFTPEMSIARDAQSAGELEPISQEITISIHGLGLSLVNNLHHIELLYIGIASSGIIWETCKANKQRFKPLSVKDCQAIEEAYVLYNTELDLGKEVTPRINIDNKFDVDFENGLMFKPAKRRLRRTFQTGLWLQMKTAPHQMQLHAKINRLQIDNQMYDCIFPVVLAPVPPPKSVAADSALKPFAELSIVQRIMPHSNVQQYKYFKVLIQEFHVKVDMGFINALLEMFEAEEVSDAEEMRLFEEDRGLVDKPLLSHVTLVSTQEQKNFYDLLHFSPLKIHLSFSLSGGTSHKAPGQGQETPRFLNVLMQSLGVTLTDVQDVVFKLAYFERQYTFLTQQQLISETTMHYVGQSVKQLYVLVLGLDVIGNPYGLVLGLTQGVEDLFYEPFQGAIQGPGEFAEGLVLGVRSLFGHTVGGAAGAVSRITGAMGKGIAALTFDKDYQRKRREAMNQRPANVQMGLAQSGKGLVMGVVDGVSGVILKPISGAKQEGVEGFFKGVGKGVMGLVTRPTAGVIDFASGSLDVVKRAAEMSDEVTRLRSPRFLQQDGLVRPYVRLEAEGNKLLQELDKGKFATTDVYVFHMPIGPTNKDTLMLTDKRVMYIVHNDIFGGWQVDWDYTWESLNAPPRIVEKGIFISTGEHKKKVLGLFGHGESGKVILIQNQEKKELLANKMMELMKL